MARVARGTSPIPIQAYNNMIAGLPDGAVVHMPQGGVRLIAGVRRMPWLRIGGIGLGAYGGYRAGNWLWDNRHALNMKFKSTTAALANAMRGLRRQRNMTA